MGAGGQPRGEGWSWSLRAAGPLHGKRVGWTEQKSEKWGWPQAGEHRVRDGEYCRRARAAELAQRFGIADFGDLQAETGFPETEEEAWVVKKWS